MTTDVTTRDHILAFYREFVQTALRRYQHDYEHVSFAPLKKDFYNRFWKIFLDELLGEANRVYGLYNADIINFTEFRSDLQGIVEKGLEDFSICFKT